MFSLHNAKEPAGLSAPSKRRCHDTFALTAMRKLSLGACGLVISLIAGCQTAPSLPLAGNPFAPVEPSQLAVGDTYVYQISDGYRNKPPQQITYRVDQIEADRIVMSVNPDTGNEGGARIESYTRDGNWLRHPMFNRDDIVIYDFNIPYPAYVFPLAPGKSWSMRVIATHPSQGRRSVRVDGKVLGAVRIRVPAGEFDTIQVRRQVYAGDTGYGAETHISETDWYAPSARQFVASEGTSSHVDTSRSGGGRGDPPLRVRGDWLVAELVRYSAQ